jgi:hypothetical protein
MVNGVREMITVCFKTGLLLLIFADSVMQFQDHRLWSQGHESKQPDSCGIVKKQNKLVIKLYWL